MTLERLNPSGIKENFGINNPFSKEKLPTRITVAEFTVKQDKKSEEVKDNDLQQIDENPPVHRKSHKVNVLYGGILSNELDWNTENLEKIAEAADLRSRVFIASRNERKQTGVENLGEVLARKKFGNPFELLTQVGKKKKNVEVRGNAEQGAVVIFLKDQQIVKEVMDKNEGKLDKKVFTQKLGGLVKDGLKEGLSWEKKQQLFYATLNDIINTAWCGAHLYIGYLGGTTVKDNVTATLITFSVSNKNDINTLINGELNIVGLFMLMYAGMMLVYDFQKFKHLGHLPLHIEHPLYLRPFKDYNPIKHIKDWAKGSFVLMALKNKDIVEHNG